MTFGSDRTKVPFYVTLTPSFGKYGDLRGVTATKLTQKRPTATQRSGSVTVKLTIDVADQAFLPLTPEATIIVNESDVEVIQPTVEPPEEPEA